MGGQPWCSEMRHLGKTKSIVRGKGAEAEETWSPWIPVWNIGRELRVKHVGRVVMVVMEDMVSKPRKRLWCLAWIGSRIEGRISMGVGMDTNGSMACTSWVHSLVGVAVGHLTLWWLNRSSVPLGCQLCVSASPPLHHPVPHWSRRQS